MTDRKRSKDGVRETDKYVDSENSPAQQGRKGGNIQRDVATQAELATAESGDEGITRVTGQDKRRNGETDA